jgi:hypothetical protein
MGQVPVENIKIKDGQPVSVRLPNTDTELPLNPPLVQEARRLLGMDRETPSTNHVSLKEALPTRFAANSRFGRGAEEFERTGNPNLSKFQVGGAIEVVSGGQDQLRGKFSEMVYWAGHNHGLQARVTFNNLIKDGRIVDSHGKVYCGKDWGFQSKKTHLELKKDGKLDLL